MNSLKAFFAGLFAAFIAVVIFIFNGKMRSQVESEKDQAETKLKEIEAHSEVEKSFEGRSDSNVVLNAIDEQLRRNKTKS